MKLIKKFAAAVLGWAVVCLPAISLAAESPSRILTVENKVSYMAANTAVWQPAKPGQVLNLGDKVRTEKDSRATVRLADLSVVRINELTTFELLPPHQ